MTQEKNIIIEKYLSLTENNKEFREISKSYLEKILKNCDRDNAMELNISLADVCDRTYNIDITEVWVNENGYIIFMIDNVEIEYDKLSNKEIIHIIRELN